MVAFSATAAVTWNDTNSSAPSASRVLPTADAVLLTTIMTNATSDTIASTIAGGSPTESYQNGAAAAVYVALYVGASSGSQTVAFSGGDATDDWTSGLRGVDDLDAADPFDNQVTDGTPTDEAISITTTADGLAVGIAYCVGTPVPNDTEVINSAVSLRNLSAQTVAGTGGAVTVDWGSTSSISAIIGLNLRNAAAADKRAVRSAYYHMMEMR